MTQLLVKSDATNLATNNNANAKTHINGEAIGMVCGVHWVALDTDAVTFHNNVNRTIEPHGHHENGLIVENNLGSAINGIGNKAVAELDQRNLLVLREEAVTNDGACLTITELLRIVGKNVSKSNVSAESINLSTTICERDITRNGYNKIKNNLIIFSSIKIIKFQIINLSFELKLLILLYKFRLYLHP